MSSDYIFSESNKKDANFFKLIYDFCVKNYIIPPENTHVVVGHSVMEIKQAVVNTTNYNVRFLDGKYRKHVTNKENNINIHSDTENVIIVKIPGYLSLPNKKVDTSEYKNVIKCIDNTMCPYMYKNNTERKRNLEGADMYLMSGKYLLGNPHLLESLPAYSVKLSFGFIKDENLAFSIQDQVNYISAGFEYSDVKVTKNILSKPHLLMSAYKKNYNLHKRGVKNVMKVINKYNDKYEDYKVNHEVEPSKQYIYITSDYKVNIKKFTDFYNKLKLKYKLYEKTEYLQRSYQSIWSPDVDNKGIFIKIFQ